MKAVDTTFLIDLLKGNAGAIRKAREIDESGGAATTVVNILEITYGIYKSRSLDHERLLSDAEKLFVKMEIFPLDVRATIEAGKVLGALSREGKTVDVLDGTIGVIALVNGCNTIVTRNVEHFSRIPNLKVETY